MKRPPPPAERRQGHRAMRKTLWLCLLYLGLLAVMMIQADTSANLGKPLEIEFQYQKF